MRRSSWVHNFRRSQRNLSNQEKEYHNTVFILNKKERKISSMMNNPPPSILMQAAAAQPCTPHLPHPDLYPLPCPCMLCLENGSENGYVGPYRAWEKGLRGGSPITQSVCRRSLPVFRSGAGGRRGSKCYSPALPVLLRHCHPVSTVPGEGGKALGEEGQQATESLNAELEGPGWVQSLKQGWEGRLWHRVSLAGLKGSLISSLRVRSWRKKVSRAAAGMGDTGTEGANTVMKSISQVSDLGVSPSSIPPVHLPLGGPLDCSA